MYNHVLPNLIIAGVNKAGTTSLFSYLALHPDICASIIKETCYFLSLRYGRQLSPINQYLQYFSHCGTQKYIMESTPGYFYGGAVVAQAIKEQLGDVRIILIFRDPIERMLSVHKFKKSRMELDQSISFAEYVHLCESLSPDERRKQENNVYWGIEGGFYADYLPAWFDVFGESLKVVFFEHLRNDPHQLLRDLCEWLLIDHAVFDSAELETENRSVNYENELLQQLALFVNDHGERFWRAHPRLKHLVRRMYYIMNGKSFQEAISDRTLAHLESLFKPYNRRLAAELSKRGYTDLPSWLTAEKSEQR